MPSDLLSTQVYSRSDLRASGFTTWRIERDVAAGHLIRLRRDRYVVSSHPDIDRAVRIGARLSCVTLLALWGAFVFDSSVLHLQVERRASRLRAADDRGARWVRSATAHRKVALHWVNLRHVAPNRHTVAILDALRCAVRCQTPPLAVATVDSVLHVGLATMAEVREVFASLPGRYAAVLAVVDARSESGTESLVRLMLRQIGATYELQVKVRGVGRVDFIIDGWLIVECDSKAHHQGWEKQQEDRRRDIAAARQGYTTIRPLAEDILYRPDEVRAALREILACRL
ncbi:endonuclease domain-containing protein [Microbacterium memoriense]|uniref:Endonuclease domain-containing protein n=1 Tax=Microbacterium memoriense TaxID=2978350 RepID=A0ABT2PC08_9MICO|nr:endonuclease domain-containing protein [Microbacterium memoriense]MCT9001960.1 endonuclease domain-containing protein [Microbacterium memoriense]